MADVLFRLGDVQAAENRWDAICALYDEVFSQPPFCWTDEESERHHQLLKKLQRNPTFGIVTAEEGESLFGFAYGYALPVETSWWEGFLAEVPGELTQEWPGRTFALIDIAVAREHRGRGYGRTLLDMLLKSRNEERVALSVQPTAEEAQAIYRHLGWRYVGRQEGWGDTVSPLWDVYVLPLQANPSDET
jgi:ribosomal protein S18 acetylase RimI-like enzyme